jgi:hypothetical protein
MMYGWGRDGVLSSSASIWCQVKAQRRKIRLAAGRMLGVRRRSIRMTW